MSDDATQRNENRSTLPEESAFTAYVSGDWADRARPAARVREQVPFCVERRRELSAAFVGKTLVIPAGQWLVRSYDTHHPYRAHSSFTYYTGWGSDTVADSVLVMTPRGSEHDATLYYRFPAGRGTDEFYSDADIGEFWVGPRPSPEDVSVELGVATSPRAQFDDIVKHADANWLVIREADPDVTAAVDAARGNTPDADQDFFRFTSEQRLVKDSFEIAEIRAAVAATKRGFEDVLRDIPEIVAHERGERLIEGTFNRRARAEGNAVGYETIAAAGEHACVLHWTRNDGPVNDGDLVLLDAGVDVTAAELEIQKKLDVITNEIFLKSNEWAGHLAAMASEEAFRTRTAGSVSAAAIVMTKSMIKSQDIQ